MSGWADFGDWEEGCGERSRGVDRWLAWGSREARKTREEGYPGEGSGGPSEWGIEVRWGLSEDEGCIAELLELNGLSRTLAFEERFIVAEEKGEVLAALSYRMASKRLLLELLVPDPWAEEPPVATALYAGAAALAWEAGIGEVRVRPNPYDDYPGEVGYRWWRGGWRSDASLPFEVWGRLPPGGWRRVFALLGFGAVPFFRAFRDQDSYPP